MLPKASLTRGFFTDYTFTAWNSLIKIKMVFFPELKQPAFKTIRLGLLVFLLLIWVLVQTYVYLHFGVKEAVDSEVYIADANLLRSYTLPTGRSFWYTGYSAVLAGIFYLGGGTKVIVLVQMLMSGVAAGAIFLLVENIGKSLFIAFTATFLYLIWIKIHEWHTIVYSDSLFTSSTIITLTVWHYAKRNWQYAVALVLFLFTCLVRPTGINFFAGIMGYVGYIVTRTNRPAPVTLAIFLIILFFITVGAFNFILQDYVPSLIASYGRAEIIYPNVSLGVPRPAHLNLPDASYPPLWQLLLFAAYNPLYFFKLFLIKATLYLAHVKPYFSTVHNVLIVLFLYPVYGLAIIGFRHFPKSPVRLFIGIFIFCQVITIGLTSENWDGRFLLPTLPYVFILAAFGAYRIWQKQVVKYLIKEK